MLLFRNVGLKIGKKQILSDLNFKVTPGETVAILGASGAGKSTIFSLMIGEQKPSKGEILLDAISLGALSRQGLAQYRRQIGVVFQDFRLLKNKTVSENIAFALEVCGAPDSAYKKIPQIMEVVGLNGSVNRFPHELSGGERQRVAIARALVHQPQILMADEATGNLDPKNSREIADLFGRLNKLWGLTLLFATHDPVLVEQLNPRVIRIDQGQLAFDKKDCPVDVAFEGLL